MINFYLLTLTISIKINELNAKKDFFAQNIANFKKISYLENMENHKTISKKFKNYFKSFQ